MRISPSVIKKVAEAAGQTVRRAGDEFFKKSTTTANVSKPKDTMDNIVVGSILVGTAISAATNKDSELSSPLVKNGNYTWYPGSSV